MPNDLVFPYKPNVRNLVLGIAFFGVIAMFMAERAETNTRDLIIEGFIRLGPDGANVTYWILAGVSIAFVAAALLGIWSALTNKTGLVLGEKELVIPPTIFRGGDLAIPYADIAAIRHSSAYKQQFLVITRRTGRPARLAASMFQSEQEFAQARAELAARARLARGR
jgi:hypothetical protein